MMRSLIAIPLSFLMLAALACGDPPVVLQGRTVGYDDRTKVLSVQDERPPQATIEFSVATADIGAHPAVGDLVRVAYRARDGKNWAIRVMNIARQVDVAGGGH